MLGIPQGNKGEIGLPQTWALRREVGEIREEREGRRPGTRGWLGLQDYSSAEDEAGLSSSDMGANEHLIFMRE